MMPAKPRPNAADTANSPASSWVSRKQAIAAAWQAEPAITVRSPPIRSASEPQAWRARKAQPSISDSMAAPCVGLMPMSPQKATMCADGIDIGMQQQKPATQSSACATLGEKPATSGRPPDADEPWRAGTGGGLGGSLRKKVAGRMKPSENTPNTSITACQPNVAMPRSKKAGHSTPATYWPDEISAIAAPRRRSNQRLT